MPNPLHMLKAQSTKEQILVSIEKLVQKKSLDKITIREICKDANISIGTFYLYFSCKEECILNIYRSADQVFHNLKLSEDARKNIYDIVYHLYDMVDFDNISFTRHIYMCHLSYFDDYFFSEEREVFQLLKKQIQAMDSSCDCAKLTWEIFEFCRGAIYNYSINPKENGRIWLKETAEKTVDYLEFLICRQCGRKKK